MLTNDFQGKTLSRLGFGTMRLPVIDGDASRIDIEQTDAMVDYCMSHGVNYFDTAYPYHGGMSERVIGKSLSRYPRESFYLATKYPGHQISSNYDPAEIFEEQLEKCRVDYFDFYLLHNVYEHSLPVYMDPKWGIMDYFLEQKRKGRIRHLGFSTHGQVPMLKEFLDQCGEHMEFCLNTLRHFVEAHRNEMEFCQIQLNYLDWTLQEAKEKYELLTERGIPVWVMEPVRGGRLANLSEEEEKRLRALRPDESAAAWTFRFLQGLPNVKMILSGMSNMEQMVENVKTFEEERPLNREETDTLLAIAEGMKNSIPCTACRYCCEGCPMQLDIPGLIAAYNEIRVAPNMNVGMRIEGMPDDKKPTACIECRKCTKVCPQNIDIPEAMKGLAQALEKIPSWRELSRQREEAAKRSKGLKL